MGCSASRCHTILTRPIEERPSKAASASASSSSSLHSSSFSDSSSSTPTAPPVVSRTLSLPTPLVHHPPLCKGDSNHLVSLTSTTYGSLLLLDHFPTSNPTINGHFPTKPIKISDPIDPSSPDSVINSWELMEGLDDDEFDFDSSIVSPNSKKGCDSSSDFEKSFEFVEHSESKPLWKHLSEESLLAKMDPNVVLSYRKALSSRHLGYKDPKPKSIRPVVAASNPISSPLSTRIHLPNAEDRIVLYFTSLRGIRKTFEDCCAVRNIFKGFGVYVDERDISMDSMYRKELQGVLGGKTLALPIVFIRGKYAGSADEIKQLHEGGELAKHLEGFRVRDCAFVCEVCGDARFVLCPNCNGSRKIFEDEIGKLSRCSDCNENGLIRCPNCYC